jgi:hypothetical protein
MLHEHASARALALARIWIFGLCLVDVAVDRLQELAGLPLDFLVPVGPLALVPSALLGRLYEPGFLVALQATLCGLLALAIVGAPGFRAIALAACALLTIQYALLRSVGYVNHAELPMLYAAVVLALAPSTDAWAWRRATPARDPAIYGASLGLIALLFCLTYTLVGVHRVLMAGPAIFTDGSLIRIVLGPALKPGIFGGSHGVELLATPAGRALMTLGFVYVTVLELVAPACLFVPTLRRIWIPSMLAFHVLSRLLMQVFFVHNVAMIPLVLVDVDWWIARAAGTLGRRGPRAGAA